MSTDPTPDDADTTIPGGPFDLSGPPEPIVEHKHDPNKDTTVKFVVPTTTDSGDAVLDNIDVGDYKCVRCGTINQRGINDDGTPVEPGYCDGCEREGPFNHAGPISDTELYAAEKAHQGFWKAPTGINTSAHGFANLWSDVRDHIERYWAAGDEGTWVYDGLTAYAISTWIRENLRFIPHILLRGATTGGKTRLLNTLARVSYRGIVSASVTPASMYRLIDKYQVTFLVSEYHGLDPDTRREVDAVVRAGQKRGEVVTRAEPGADGYEPAFFDPFAHIAIASQFDPDDDIINRCVQLRSSRARDRDIPVDFHEPDAAAIRNQLLYARYCIHNSDKYDQAEAAALEWLANEGIEGRTREKLLSLVTVARLFDRLDDLKPMVEEVVEQDHEAREDSDDANFVRAVRTLAHKEVANTSVLTDGDPYGAIKLPYGDVAHQYAVVADLDPDRVSNTKIGHMRKRLGLGSARGRNGTSIHDQDLGPKLQELCKNFNVAWKPDDETQSTADADDDGGGEFEQAKPQVLRIIKQLHGGSGEVSLPAVLGKAEAAGLSEETTRDAISELKKTGEITNKNAGGDATPVYYVN